jgi:hypothetical protein
LLDTNGKISADVWLYNRCPAPVEPEWVSPEKMPFANPVGFVRDDIDILLPDSADDVRVLWETRDGKEYAQVLLKDVPVAELTIGAKPGWSRLAKRDGPLAQVWRNG